MVICYVRNKFNIHYSIIILQERRFWNQLWISHSYLVIVLPPKSILQTVFLFASWLPTGFCRYDTLSWLHGRRGRFSRYLLQAGACRKAPRTHTFEERGSWLVPDSHTQAWVPYPSCGHRFQLQFVLDSSFLHLQTHHASEDVLF